MKHKSAGKFFLQSSLLLLLLLSLVYLLGLKGSSLAAEKVVLALLLLLSVVGLAAYHNYGKKILFVVFSLYILNLLSLWYFYHWRLHMTLIFVSLLGLWVSLQRRSEKKCEDYTCEPAVTSTSPPQKVGEAPPVEPVEAAEVPAKTKFTPGKYVASKRSNVYHEPKCDWAKKIQKDRRLWFASREEALDKGYKKHGCVN